MIRLAKALNAWDTPEFERVLKQELEQLDADELPLQQGLSAGSYAVANKLKAMVIGVREGEGVIRARVGLFYKGILLGCSCADDPTPDSEHDEYCEVQLDIDRRTGEATVALLP